MKFLPCWVPRHSYFHVMQRRGGSKGSEGAARLQHHKSDILKNIDSVDKMISDFYKL